MLSESLNKIIFPDWNIAPYKTLISGLSSYIPFGGHMQVTYIKFKFSEC